MAFDLFQRIKGLQTYLASWPGVDQTLSIVDYSELLDRAIQRNGTVRELAALAQAQLRPLQKWESPTIRLQAFGGILSNSQGSPNWCT